MKQIKKMLISLVAVCLLFSTAGCIVQVNTEKNRNITVALIDKKYEVKKGDYIDMFNYYVALYAAYGIDLTDSKNSKMLDEVRQNCITALVNNEICEIEMDKVDFKTNDEDRESARKDFEESIQKLADQYKEEAEKEAKNNTATPSPDSTATPTPTETPAPTATPDSDTDAEERDFVQEARDYYKELIEKRGMTEDEYIDEMAKDYRLKRFKKFILSDELDITDEKILEYYNEQLDAQKLKPNLDADVLIYEPSGVSYKYIKVALTKEEQEIYDKYIEEEKEDEAEAYIKETSYKRAAAYLVRIKNGESFEDVMKDANKYLVENCGVSEDDVKDPEEELKLYKSVGSTGFAGTLDTKLLAAAKDDVTSVLDAQKGVYVIGKCYGRFESVTHKYEVGNDIYNDIKEKLEDDAVSEKWDDKLKSLKEAHDIKIYTNRINKNY